MCTLAMACPVLPLPSKCKHIKSSGRKLIIYCNIGSLYKLERIRESQDEMIGSKAASERCSNIEGGWLSGWLVVKMANHIFCDNTFRIKVKKIPLLPDNLNSEFPNQKP